MFGCHLPLSDQGRAWLFEASGYLCAALFIPMILLNISFYWTGSQVLDPSTRRVYPVNEHGILYVVPWQGEVAMDLFWGFMIVLVFGFIVNPHRGRLFLLQNE